MAEHPDGAIVPAFPLIIAPTGEPWLGGQSQGLPPAIERRSVNPTPRLAAARKESNLTRTRTIGLLVTTAALAALLVVAVGGGAATAKPAHTKAKKTAVIDMAKQGKDQFFEGRKTVAAGANLKIRNLTNPRAVGPHSFSLVQKNDRPKGKNQIKKCEKQLKLICGQIILWHQVDINTNPPTIGENPVEVGKQGWDRMGNFKRKGDSWIAERKNEKFKRKVTAKPGKTLYFMCVVHPFMQGKIKVVKG